MQLTKGKVFKAAEEAGIHRKMLPVFFTLEAMIKSNEDLRTAAACREIADYFGWQFMFVHRAIKALVKAGWLAENTKSRRFKMLKLGPAYLSLGDPDRDMNFDTAKVSKTRVDFSSRDTENDTGRDTTSSSPVVVSPLGVVAVSHSGSDVKKRHAPQNPARAQPKIEGLQQLKDHLMKTWVAKTGLKPFEDRAGWVLVVALTHRYPTENIAALWDRYLRGNDPFHRKQGFNLRLFHAAIDGIALEDLTYKRDGERYYAAWYGKPLVGARIEPARRVASTLQAPSDLPGQIVKQVESVPDGDEQVDSDFVSRSFDQLRRRQRPKIETVATVTEEDEVRV